MYHYSECGLPNVYLVDGYRTLETEYGEAVSIEDIENLHAAMCQTLVEEKPSVLSGAEVRFIRKHLELTQAALADYLGVQEQSVRGWEHRETIPRTADRLVRMAYRDITRSYSKTLDQLARTVSSQRRTERVEYAHRPGGNGHWDHQLITA